MTVRTKHVSMQDTDLKELYELLLYVLIVKLQIQRLSTYALPKTVPPKLAPALRWSSCFLQRD